MWMEELGHVYGTWLVGKHGVEVMADSDGTMFGVERHSVALTVLDAASVGTSTEHDATMWFTPDHAMQIGLALIDAAYRTAAARAADTVQP